MTKKVLSVVILLILFSSCSSQANVDQSKSLEEAQHFYDNANLDSAEYYVDKIIKESKTNDAAYFLKGKISLDKENTEDAIKFFNKAQELNDTNWEYYHYDGIANYILDKPQLAIEKFTQSIELNPSNPLDYYNRGQCYYNIGMMDLALKDHIMYNKLDNSNQPENKDPNVVFAELMSDKVKIESSEVEVILHGGYYLGKLKPQSIYSMCIDTSNFHINPEETYVKLINMNSLEQFNMFISDSVFHKPFKDGTLHSIEFKSENQIITQFKNFEGLLKQFRSYKKQENEWKLISVGFYNYKKEYVHPFD